MHEFFMVAKNLDLTLENKLNFYSICRTVCYTDKRIFSYATEGIKNNDVGEELDDSDCVAANGDDAIIKEEELQIKADDEGEPSKLNVNYVANDHRKAKCLHCDKAYCLYKK